MADFSEENKENGVFGGVNFDTPNNTPNGAESSYFDSNSVGIEENTTKDNSYENKEAGSTFTQVKVDGLPVKPSVWTKIRSFLFQEIDLTAPIKVELTPYQQKVENEINEFLHQEISFKGFWNIITGK